MAHRLVLCFDGTWNRPDDNPDPARQVNTNVVRFFRSVLCGRLADGSTQEAHYDDGVGSDGDWFEHIAGGAFGLGIDAKIRDGYAWLAAHWPDPDPGDTELFIVGFSRGAYTARSLVGLIRKAGLLKPAAIGRLGDAYDLYRRRDSTPDSPEAVQFRAANARDIAVQFIGVWDTVGALGIPSRCFALCNAAEYGFHDTGLSKIVRRAVHAVAVDEHREDYQPTLWTSQPVPGQHVEQRWFPGAHADVGGGYPQGDLADITLAWMQSEAVIAGLAIDPAQIPVVTSAKAAGVLHDSYAEFLNGAYAEAHPPFYRPMALDQFHQTFDPSLRARWDQVPGYPPQNPGLPFAPLRPLPFRMAQVERTDPGGAQG